LRKLSQLNFVIHPGTIPVPVTSLAGTISAFFCPKIFGYYKTVKTNLWKKQTCLLTYLRYTVSKLNPNDTVPGGGGGGRVLP